MQFPLPLVLPPLAPSVVGFTGFVRPDPQRVHVHRYLLACCPALPDDDVVDGDDLVLLVLERRRDDVRLDQRHQSWWHDERTGGRRVGPESEILVTVNHRVFVDGILQVIYISRDSVSGVIFKDVVDAQDNDSVDRLRR